MNKKAQQGVSIMGMVSVAVVVAILGALVMQAVPTWVESVGVGRLVDRLALQGGTAEHVREAFNRAAPIENISSLKGEDLRIALAGDKLRITYEYDKEIHLAGPAYLLLRYSGASK